MSRKPRKANREMHLWLSRIIDDLSPTDFSVRELIDEFGAATVTEEEKSYLNGEKHIRAQLAQLVESEFVEKIAKGRYAVTEAGTAFRDRTDV